MMSDNEPNFNFFDDLDDGAEDDAQVDELLSDAPLIDHDEQGMRTFEPLTPPEPPVEVEVVDSKFSDPRVRELNMMLAEIIGEMDEWEPEVSELDAVAKSVKDEKRSFLIEVNKKMRDFDTRIKAAEADKKAIERKLRDAEEQKQRIMADIDHRFEELDAHKMLAEAQQRWADLVEKHDWLWAHVAFEYQLVGIQYIASGIPRNLGGIALLDDMGLGKTLQARGAIDVIQTDEKWPEMLHARMPGWTPDASWSSCVLWVCPSSIKYDTAKELRKWSSAQTVVLDGEPAVRDHIVRMANMAGMVLIVGYEQMRNRGELPVTPELFKHKWPIIVMDEVQKAKNRDSGTFHNLKKLVQNSAYVIPMTGTPVDNKAEEFWTILHLLTQKGKRMGEFDKFAWFASRYLWSSSNSFMHGKFDELMSAVSDMVIRRRKDEVLKDLPDMIREVRTVQMQGKQLELYRMMRERLYVWLDEQKSDSVSATNFLAQLTRLRQINLLPSSVKIKVLDDEGNDTGETMTLECDESAKVDEAMKLIRMYMENDKKIVVFANFNHVLYHIEKLVKEEGLTWTDVDGKVRPVETASITGDTKKQLRPEIVARFNDEHDDMRVLVCNIMAGGVGLNLQGACSSEIFLDLYWNPGPNAQAEARLHRQGQKNNVMVHIIQTEDSVDEFIAMILEEKSDTSHAMFERSELRKALDDGLI